MSSNQRPPRGQASKNARPTASQTGNTQRFPVSQQATPHAPGNINQSSRPQIVRPRATGNQSVNPSGASANVLTPRPQISRPGYNNNQSVNPSQVTQLLGKMTSDDGSKSMSRGAIRGRQVIESGNYYRAVRPESSKGGKQGKSGQPLTLISNYFPIKSYTDWTIYQYCVKFNPEEEKLIIRRGLLSNHKELLGTYIFDGAMLFSNKKYDSNELDLTSQRSFDGQIVKISITFVSVIETGDYAAIQLFNLLLRNCLRHLELTLVGRNYYDSKAKIQLKNFALQLWPGYETTIGMYDSGLLLRSEITTKVMRDETVLDFFIQCRQNRAKDPDWLNTFKSNVIGTTVLTKYNNKTYRIDDVKNESVKSTFKKKDGTQMSYVDYYKERWQITIREPSQPLLISKKKKFKFSKDEESDIICLIPELCTLTGMTTDMRNNNPLTTAMSAYTSVSPKDRLTRYNNFMARLMSSSKSVETLSRWNLQLTNKLVEVPARVLPPQTISGNKGTYSAGGNADWTTSVRSSPMFTSARVDSWIVVAPQMSLDRVNPFLFTLKKVCDGMSFILPRPEIVPIQTVNNRSYLDALEKIICSKNPSFILCVTSQSRGDLYSIIKRKLCVERAILSQVVLLKNVERNNMSVCTKIGIQINSKLGGIPWLVKIPKSGLLIIGYDVCHDSHDKSKSYGAITATLNDTQSAYFSCCQQHAGGEEISNYFSSSITKILLAYKSKNKDQLPSGIIIYRDGVGDGQLSYVHQTELKETKLACKQFYDKKGLNVPLAFVIVKKRINTRFIMDKNNPRNPPPGTVVDSVVTDPTMYDFYLVSQNVNKGTVTPTHYNVIEDTLPNWTPDYMQQVTYKLSHMYFNWSGTVRVPAPCQLAHKLAFLASQVLKRNPNISLNEHLYYL